MQLESSPPIFMKWHWMPKTKWSHAFEEKHDHKRVLEAVLKHAVKQQLGKPWIFQQQKHTSDILWPSLRCHETSQETEKLKPSKCVNVVMYLSHAFIIFHLFASISIASQDSHEWNHFLIAGGAPTAVAFSHMIGWCCWYTSEMDITSPFHKTLNANQPVTYFAETTTCRWGGLIRKILAFCC